MLRKAFCILTISAVLFLAGGCRNERNLGDLTGAASDGVWRASSTESAVLEAVDYSIAKGFTDDVKQKLVDIKAGGITGESLRQWKLMTEAMTEYDFEQDSLSEYVGALHGAADCLYGFYLFNSTQAMLEERLTGLSEAYSQIGTLEKTTIIPPEAEFWTSASAAFTEYGEKN